MEFKTRLQLANEYGIDRKTLAKKLVTALIVLPKAKRISPKDIEQIYSVLGNPFSEQNALVIPKTPQIRRYTRQYLYKKNVQQKNISLMKHSLINLNILQLFAFSQRRQIVSIFLFVLLDFLPIQAQTFFYKAWIQTGSTLESGFINHIVSTTNSTGESYVAGSTLNTNGTHSMILTKYNSKGTQAWSTQFTVDVAGQVFVGGIALDASGNIIVTGSAYNGTSNNYDIFVVKYNNAGSKLWHQLRNGTANSYDFGTAVVCASNGDIFVTGESCKALLI